MLSTYVNRSSELDLKKEKDIGKAFELARGAVSTFPLRRTATGILFARMWGSYL